VKALDDVAVCDRVYVDESGCDDRLQREYGWSPRGVPCFDTRLGHAGERLSVIAAWMPMPMPMPMPTPGLMAPLSFDGTCHSRLFELWLRVMLCPLLRAGQVVILDNARFHRKKAVQRLLRRVGCRALFLPAYSPDLNLIEPQWHGLKTRVRTNRLHGMTFKHALETALV
jgi:transposase InsO family protein